MLDEISHNLGLGVVAWLHLQQATDPAKLAKPVIWTGITGGSSGP